MATATLERQTVTQCHTRKDTRQVLRYVNRIRRDFGLQPLGLLARGRKGNADSCSIAASLTTKYTDATVDGESIEMRRYSRLRGNIRGNMIKERTYESPAYVTAWVAKFDAGAFPALLK